MHDSHVYDYSIVRVVPRVDREEFVNVGVIVSCPARDFLEAHIELDELRVKALDPGLDMESIRTHLAAIAVICSGGPEAGEIGMLPPRRRFEWLTAPRSTVIQTSPVHTGYCQDPGVVLESLLETMVRIP
ncbi:MAG TPA: DUF3037 domain-containing protein [Blastocatellia bacterium]|nr:DUF3037 domain-containing protein [Blastocatellia bacterium]